MKRRELYPQQHAVYAVILITLMALNISSCHTFSRSSSAPGVDTEIESLDTTEPYEAPLLAPPGLRLATDQRFKDIPLPVGVKEDLARTYVYESRTLQIGRMVYSTRASLNELAQFFLRECPAADWKLERVVEAESSKSLYFSKPQKHLEVTIKKLGFGRNRRLTITLTPNEETAAP